MTHWLRGQRLSQTSSPLTFEVLVNRTRHRADPEQYYSPQAQARAIVALMEELGVSDAVLVGYDVGSLGAQTVAAMRPDLVKALVVSPPLPGGGKRVLQISAVTEFRYMSFHQLDLIEQILDGRPDGIRYYLQHFWNHWSGPDYRVDEGRLDHLTTMYSKPGAFLAAAQWYRSSGNPVTAYVNETKPAPADRLATPTTVLWQEHDAIFPQAWSDCLSDFFSDYTYTELPGVGHFTPLATDEFAEAIRQRVRS